MEIHREKEKPNQIDVKDGWEQKKWTAKCWMWCSMGAPGNCNIDWKWLITGFDKYEMTWNGLGGSELGFGILAIRVMYLEKISVVIIINIINMIKVMGFHDSVKWVVSLVLTSFV